MHDRILIIDFGSQVTQLIARRVREVGVYSEIVPFQLAEKALDWQGLKGVILSGGPASVHEGGSPRAPERVSRRGVPCSASAMASRPCARSWAARSSLPTTANSAGPMSRSRAANALFDGVWNTGERHQVWMSHGDRVTAIPARLRGIAATEGAPFAAIADEKRQFYAMQFHRKWSTRPMARKLLRNFVPRSAAATATGPWPLQAEKRFIASGRRLASSG